MRPLTDDNRRFWQQQLLQLPEHHRQILRRLLIRHYGPAAPCAQPQGQVPT